MSDDAIILIQAPWRISRSVSRRFAWPIEDSVLGTSEADEPADVVVVHLLDDRTGDRATLRVADEDVAILIAARVFRLEDEAADLLDGQLHLTREAAHGARALAEA